MSGIEYIKNTINSSDVSTGALIIDGGVGIQKNLYVGGTFNVVGDFSYSTATIYSTINATNASTGALKISGGVGIAKDLYVGGDFVVDGSMSYDMATIHSTMNATDPSSGALKVYGGVGIAKDLYVGGDFVVDGNMSYAMATIHSTVNSTDTATGSLKVYGGVGIAKDLFIGGSLNTLQNSCGGNIREIVNLPAPIPMNYNDTTTIYTLSISKPTEIQLSIIGYDTSTRTYTFVCQTDYIFAMESINSVSLNGPHGSPESLYSTYGNSGWKFSPGAFTFVDNGGGMIDIKFTHNGEKTDALEINTIVVNITKAIWS